MMRTQIQLPDDLYLRARRLAAEREMSLAELTRRGLELLLDRYAPSRADQEPWRIPQVNGGGLKIALADIREFTAGDEASRSQSGAGA